MYCTRKVTDDLTWVGADDRRLACFEGVYGVPDGVSYNSYLLIDDKTVLFDTVDKAVSRTFFENVAHALGGRKLDYLVISHMEPDHAAMIEAVEKDGWDGEWFLRAYDAFGHKVGSDENKEGKIFIEPQGMCVMAGIGVENGMAQKAMDASKKYLEFEYGDVLLWPAYTEYHLELGEISSYPPGYKENGSVFCHNNPWISIAETVLGRGNRAFEVYRKICPSYIEEISDIHRTEPYVYSQMIAGADAPGFGEAKNSWLTGTAAWTFINLSQALLGILPGYDGLIVDPCLPETFGDFKVNRHFRGADYHIEIHKPKGVQKGVRWIEVDGERINGNQIPMVNGRNEYHVIVQMG